MCRPRGSGRELVPAVQWSVAWGRGRSSPRPSPNHSRGVPDSWHVSGIQHTLGERSWRDERALVFIVVLKTVTCRDGRHGMPEEAEGPRACRRKQGRPHGRQHVQVGVLPGRCGERRGQSGRSRVVLATLFVTCSPSLPRSSSLTEHRCRRGRRSHSRLPGLPPGCGQPCVQEPPVKVLGLKKAFALITTVKEKGGAVTE